MVKQSRRQQQAGACGSTCTDTRRPQELRRQTRGADTLVQSLVALDLVDELRLMVFPVVLGGGKQLFAEVSDTTTLILVETRQTGSVAILTLRRER